MFKFIICIAVAYLLGNISGGMIFGKLLFNKDIRDYGSKNAGTTNALRVFGIKAGALTFIVDVLKSLLACFIGMKLLGLSGILLAGIFVVIGHNWPRYIVFIYIMYSITSHMDLSKEDIINSRSGLFVFVIMTYIINLIFIVLGIRYQIILLKILISVFSFLTVGLFFAFTTMIISKILDVFIG